jgi:hypothetical protein
MCSMEISEVCPANAVIPEEKQSTAYPRQPDTLHRGQVASAKNRCLQSDVLKLRPSHRKTENTRFRVTRDFTPITLYTQLDSISVHELKRQN